MGSKKTTIHKPNGSAKWFIFPDIHFPEQDPEALAVALEAHRIFKPDYTVLLGDVVDCGLFSLHPKKSLIETEAYDYHQLEIIPCNRFLDQVQKQTKRHTYYLEGNHEFRIERWAVNNGRLGESLYKLISPQVTLGGGRKNFTMIPYCPPTNDYRGFLQIVPQSPQMKTGGLVAVHGWSFARHAAAVHLDRSRSQSIVFGHVHRQLVNVSRDPWTGQIIKAFCPGTLSKLQPIYAVSGAPSDWCHGFGMLYVGNQSWTEYIVSITNGRCVMPDGKEIRLA